MATSHMAIKEVYKHQKNKVLQKLHAEYSCNF